MNMIHETAAEIPVAYECDLCVIGGSCTGVFAAVRAARLGAKVALVEKNGFFGGVATAGLVNVWYSLHDTVQKLKIISGLTEEIIQRLNKRHAVKDLGPHPYRGHGGWTLNTAELMIELDELVQEAGVRPFLHTLFVNICRQDSRITAAIIEDKSGRRAIKASMFIDASGDGDLIMRAGLPLRRPEKMQPPTTCAVLSGLREVEQRNAAFSLARVVHDTRYPEALPPSLLWNKAIPGIEELTLVAGTRVWNADCSDAESFTAAELEGRRQVRAICDLLRRRINGGQKVHLGALSSSIGIRETRHAECLHRLTEQEILSGTRFPDAIANGSAPIDIHHADEPGLTYRLLDGREIRVVPGKEPKQSRWIDSREPRPTFYQVPFRSLVPRGEKNVLVAGRVIDADTGAFGAVRVMVICNQLGEAAGTAAVKALEDGVEPARLDPARLRQALSDGGSAVL